MLRLSRLSISSDEQAENNLRAVGKNLSRLARQSGVTGTPIKYQHQQHPNFFHVQGNSEVPVQDGRSRQSKNKYSRCLLTEITNSQDTEKSESQFGSQSFEEVNLWNTTRREGTKF